MSRADPADDNIFHNDCRHHNDSAFHRGISDSNQISLCGICCGQNSNGTGFLSPSEYCGFLLSASCHQRSILVHQQRYI